MKRQLARTYKLTLAERKLRKSIKKFSFSKCLFIQANCARVFYRMQKYHKEKRPTIIKRNITVSLPLRVIYPMELFLRSRFGASSSTFSSAHSRRQMQLRDK